jgi:hypothetical protein
MKKKRQTIQIVKTSEGRFVVTTHTEGDTTRTRVEPNQRPKRKPRKPIARAWRAEVTPRNVHEGGQAIVGNIEDPGGVVASRAEENAV